MEEALINQLRRNINMDIESEEIALMQRARTSSEVQEAKRISRNVKLQLIEQLKHQANELQKSRYRITNTMRKEEDQIRRQIKALREETNQR